MDAKYLAVALLVLALVLPLAYVAARGYAVQEPKYKVVIDHVWHLVFNPVGITEPQGVFVDDHDIMPYVKSAFLPFRIGGGLSWFSPQPLTIGVTKHELGIIVEVIKEGTVVYRNMHDFDWETSALTRTTTVFKFWDAAVLQPGTYAVHFRLMNMQFRNGEKESWWHITLTEDGDILGPEFAGYGEEEEVSDEVPETTPIEETPTEITYRVTVAVFKEGALLKDTFTAEAIVDGKTVASAKGYEGTVTLEWKSTYTVVVATIKVTYMGVSDSKIVILDSDSPSTTVTFDITELLEVSYRLRVIVYDSTGEPAESFTVRVDYAGEEVARVEGANGEAIVYFTIIPEEGEPDVTVYVTCEGKTKQRSVALDIIATQMSIYGYYEMTFSFQEGTGARIIATYLDEVVSAEADVTDLASFNVVWSGTLPASVPLDPGDYRVYARYNLDGEYAHGSEEFEVKPGEWVTVTVKLYRSWTGPRAFVPLLSFLGDIVAPGPVEYALPLVGSVDLRVLLVSLAMIVIALILVLT